MKSITEEELIDELKKRLQEKQQSVAELTRLSEELKIVNKKLSDSEALKSNFLANIRNEIINPFSSIIGLSRHIINVKKEDWKKVITMASLIHSEAFELNFQLKNIFAAAELEAGEAIPQYAKVDITSVLNEVMENFSPIVKGKKITMIMENSLQKANEPWYFITDPSKLELILSNILKNAIEFSLENSEVKITAGFDSKTETLIISIKDNGIGISASNIDKIFDRFARLNNSINSKVKGHGLGLTVSKAMLDMLNGKISVESESGVGSVFTIQLPKSEQNAAIEGMTGKSNEMFFEGDEKF